MTLVHYMSKALQEAEAAFEENEVPIGCVVVCGDRIIGKGYNQTERLQDVTAHAEIIAITAAANFLGNKYLQECHVYVTLEPCPMCAYALQLAQIETLIFGAPDPSRGFQSVEENLLHPKTKIVPGIEEEACSELLKAFFRKKRKP